jgi:signal transduction histidine kinase
MGPGVDVTTVLPLKETFREYVVEVVRELSPYFPDITARWRERITRETNLDARTIATLERITIACSAEYFAYRDFHGFLENLNYFGTRLAKLQVDTRIIHGALETYEELCEPYLSSLFPDNDVQAMTALEMASSVAFTSVSGAYFDTRTRESNCLLSVLDVELGEMDLTPMLQRVLEITCTTFEAIVGSILLRDPEPDLLRVEATVGMDENLRGEFPIDLAQGFAEQITRTGEPDMVMDARHDERILHSGLRLAKAVWGMPLKYDGKTIGVMVIGFDKPYEWLPTERELLRAIADRSALAIHRARITQALRERETRIAELSAHLLRVQEEERKRISRELHDETGQGLMVIRLYLGMLAKALKSKAAKAKVDETLEVVDRTVEGIRRIIGHLSPLSLQELGLFAAVRKEAHNLELNRGVKVRVAIDDNVGRLSAETETAIYRIVQEALHNIAKHANAKNADITMTREDDRIRLLVEDDGVGIFPKSNFRGNSFGLAGIKERVGMLGGDVRVSSSKGKGTRVELTVPATEPTGHARLGLRPQYMDLNEVNEKGATNAENKMPTH